MNLPDDPNLIYLDLFITIKQLFKTQSIKNTLTNFIKKDLIINNIL